MDTTTNDDVSSSVDAYYKDRVLYYLDGISSTLDVIEDNQESIITSSDIIVSNSNIISDNTSDISGISSTLESISSNQINTSSDVSVPEDYYEVSVDLFGQIAFFLSLILGILVCWLFVSSFRKG